MASLSALRGRSKKNTESQRLRSGEFRRELGNVIAGADDEGIAGSIGQIGLLERLGFELPDHVGPDGIVPGQGQGEGGLGFIAGQSGGGVEDARKASPWASLGASLVSSRAIPSNCW